MSPTPARRPWSDTWPPATTRRHAGLRVRAASVGGEQRRANGGVQRGLRRGDHRGLRVLGQLLRDQAECSRRRRRGRQQRRRSSRSCCAPTHSSSAASTPAERPRDQVRPARLGSPGCSTRYPGSSTFNSVAVSADSRSLAVRHSSRSRGERTDRGGGSRVDVAGVVMPVEHVGQQRLVDLVAGELCEAGWSPRSARTPTPHRRA